MTLRLRLVLALAALVTIGLVVFGVATYSLYARSQYERLDDQLRTSVGFVTGKLYEQAGLDGYDNDGDDYDGGGDPGAYPDKPSPPLIVPSSTYAELRGPDGTVLSTLQIQDPTSQPDLPEDLDPPVRGQWQFTTGSVSGSGEWRVGVSQSDHQDGNIVVVAVPLAEVAESLNRLILIEAVAGAVLLALLSGGAWLILRRGLRPLEHMADSARSITAGDLSPRVEPADDRTEVGQLGLALNTMLGEIEGAFDEREATERRLRQFLADASHELRTPLTSIQGFAELFRHGGDQDHVDLAIIMRRIEQESARMRILVEDLLLLARLDETRSSEREPVDLAVLAADACSDAVAAAPDRPITLDAPDPVIVLGDGDHLRQAIANLVGNALTHARPAGDGGQSPIEVAARRTTAGAVVEVRDHGPGLDPEAMEHVFDRFWRADPSRTGSGSGLGLSIVSAIAQEHGGKVEAANPPGGGAVFTLTLPRVAPAETLVPTLRA